MSPHSFDDHSRGRSRRRVAISQINITPVVDVMLVLLIIFMIASPMLVSGIHVDLPETKSSPVSGNDEPLSISIDKNGFVYIMNTKIDKSELIEKLKSISHEKYDTRIFVRGDKNVPYGEIISVVGQINSAGYTKVSLITSIKQNDK
ncbi:MAG: protein TolR [Rickettsiaceae bacterium]|nr:protein TolR [Rickettsiaceae bacterium]